MKRTIMVFVLGFVFAISTVAFQTGGIPVSESITTSAIDADGTFTTVTLATPSWDCTFVNRDTTVTNTLDLTINGDTDTIRLYGGDSYSTNVGQVPMLVTSFSSAAVVGTPDIQYFCFGS